VLLLEDDRRFESTPYLLTRVMREWKDDGITVDVVRGPDRLGVADIVIPHFDVTVTPPVYSAALDRRPAVLNRRVVSIAKSTFSDLMLDADDGYTGPVIVKTDRNYGGLPEARLRSSSAPAPVRILRAVLARLRRLRAAPVIWSQVQTMRPDAYPVYASLRDVPRGVFDNDSLIVEKFCPELEGEDYCVRYHYFLGDCEFNMRLRSKAKVVRGSGAHHCEELPTIPDEIYSIRRRLGLGYGKLDYVMRDGAVVLLDVNRTPACSVLDRFGLTEKVARQLAAGIHASDAASRWE
jgi:hypothetical protein